MLVRKNMLLAVFQTAVAFAAVPKLHLRIGNLRASADCTFVLRDSGTRSGLGELRTELFLSLALLPCDMVFGKPEEQKHI
jgi:hypothetical protein